eukprot:TRINITY_DN3039_c0_g1_i1.p1 TRINITY_DN3039_c0_g1~~TRINITY_DN3039_c0_g1_i1.p1  ORF type:complete len:225 (+),score=60.24 TRINITY_DN3039_c0_g1_i1:43-717(+)
MSKISRETIDNAVREIYNFSTEVKPRNFQETVELQIGLKNYDIARAGKRFSGNIVLPSACKTGQKIMVIANQAHMDEIAALPEEWQERIHAIDVDGCKAFKKNKKVVKKWARKYDSFLASDSLIRQVTRLLGPTLNKMGLFPSPVSNDEVITEKYDEVLRTVKFQLKKVLCMGVAIGHLGLEEQQVQINAVTSINFLVSLLPKTWQNVKSLHIKSTMGPVQRIY